MRMPEPGLRTHDRERATPGYTLFSPIRGDRAFLIDMAGEPVHEWKLQGLGGVNRCEITEDGTLFVAQATLEGPPLLAGKGGLIREYDWDGNIVWEHYDENHHHDARRLANGNTLYIAWDPFDEATAQRVKGGVPGTERDGTIYGDLVREIDASGDTVWEWRIRDAEIERYPICGICQREEFGHANTCSPLPGGDVMLELPGAQPDLHRRAPDRADNLGDVRSGAGPPARLPLHPQRQHPGLRQRLPRRGRRHVLARLRDRPGDEGDRLAL